MLMLKETGAQQTSPEMTWLKYKTSRLQTKPQTFLPLKACGEAPEQIV